MNNLRRRLVLVGRRGPRRSRIDIADNPKSAALERDPLGGGFLLTLTAVLVERRR